MAEKQTPIFIVSAGRSGSTFLAKVISDHPALVCISDLFEPVGPTPYFDIKDEVTGCEFFRDILAVASTKPRLRYWRERDTKERLFVPEDENLISLFLSYTVPFVDQDVMGVYEECKAYFENRSPKTPADHFTDFCEWMKERYNGELWVERTGGSLPHTGKIINTWPNAKIIHSYRDGRECSISMHKYPFFRMYLKMEENPNLDEWDFDEMPPIEDIGRMWNNWVLHAQEAMKSLPDDQKRWISYENLMQNPEHELEKLIKYIMDKDGLSEQDHQWIERNVELVKPSTPKFKDLSDDEQKRLQAACAEGLKALNYK